MKKMYLSKTILMALLILTLSCKKKEETKVAPEIIPTFDLAAAKADVISAGELFVIAFNNGDSISAADCYTNDAKIMRPNNKSIVGRSNIQKAFTERLKNGKLRFSMKTVAVWGEENILTAEEEWMLSDNKGKIIDEGKSLEVYKKEDGKWKMVRDCFNSNFPCPK